MLFNITDICTKNSFIPGLACVMTQAANSRKAKLVSMFILVPLGTINLKR